VRLELGGHDKNIVVQQDLIIPSPGVPADSPLLKAANANGVAIWSEIELAYRFRKGKLIGITGSNGKNYHPLLWSNISCGRHRFRQFLLATSALL